MGTVLLGKKRKINSFFHFEKKGVINEQIRKTLKVLDQSPPKGEEGSKGARSRKRKKLRTGSSPVTIQRGTVLPPKIQERR